MEKVKAFGLKIVNGINSGGKKKAPEIVSHQRTVAGREKKEEGWSTSTLSFARFPMRDQVHFAKRMSFLIKAGVPILECLHIMRAQSRSRLQGRIFDRVIDDISNGLYLSTSLSRFGRYFGGFAINLIRVGEMGGVLNQNFEYLAEELRKKHELRKKVMGALVYPIFISIATLVLTALLTVFIFPKLMPIFNSLSVELPTSTIILIKTSEFLRLYGLYLVGGIILFIVAFAILMRRAAPFKFFVDRLVLRLPITGPITKGYYMTNFTRTLGLLLRSGIGIVEALSITGDTLSNSVYRRECKILSDNVIRGEKISKRLAGQRRLFPDIISHMIAIGETSGNLSDTLLYLAELYEHEVDDRTKNLSSSIEPVLMIFMGIIVGFVAVSVITPIYEITQNLSR